jgi:hypothetical protein
MIYFFIVFVKDLIFALLITRLYFEVLVTFFSYIKTITIHITYMYYWKMI